MKPLAQLELIIERAHAHQILFEPTQHNESRLRRYCTFPSHTNLPPFFERPPRVSLASIPPFDYLSQTLS